MGFPDILQKNPLEDSEGPLMSPETLRNYIFELKYLLEITFGEKIFETLTIEEINEVLKKSHFHENSEMVIYAYGLLLFFPTNKHNEDILTQRQKILEIAQPYILFLQLKKIEKFLEDNTHDQQEIISTLKTIKIQIDTPIIPQIVKELFYTLAKKVKLS